MIITRVLSSLTRIAAVLVGIAVATCIGQPAVALNPFVETFDGGAFDVSGWNFQGTSGTFLTNGFGEEVFELTNTTAPQDVIFRLVGDGDFEWVTEISNPRVSSGRVQLRVVDDGGQDFLALSVDSGGGGTLDAELLHVLDGTTQPVTGTVNLGSNVDMVTLRVLHQGATAGLGGTYTAEVDVNESGVFQTIGSINEPTFAATNSRNINLAVFNGAGAQFDFTSIQTPIPEPTTSALIPIGAVTCLVYCRRMRRGGAV